MTRYRSILLDFFVVHNIFLKINIVELENASFNECDILYCPMCSTDRAGRNGGMSQLCVSL